MSLSSPSHNFGGTLVHPAKGRMPVGVILVAAAASDKLIEGFFRCGITDYSGRIRVDFDDDALAKFGGLLLGVTITTRYGY